MKKIILLALTLASVSSMARSFRVNADVSFNNTHAQAVVQNYWNRAMVCSGRASGFTQNGVRLDSFMNNVVIYPGSYAYINVYTNRFDPFMDVRASVKCRF
ncbi:hypothetical protein M899_1027 [Bacteriovorax sp. BSW11_IV]|uniref:hypothetical protein n=1 Tax=Bacteriovorax sp. BSW11_IV TaxID=1353529 RepID=UPI000389E587|nr:hypothetical protein [Bacteriovorax sp. BSW11_IV]EQC48655.1 hypothetical protein M899_1027 [Bacteriovorax sp. BSW11_IV]